MWGLWRCGAAWWGRVVGGAAHVSQKTSIFINLCIRSECGRDGVERGELGDTWVLALLGGAPLPVRRRRAALRVLAPQRLGLVGLVWVLLRIVVLVVRR